MVTYETPPEMLRACLESVRDSDHRPTQVVVVDNSVTGRVAEFLDSWKAQLVQTDVELVFERQKSNVGYAVATNRGIAASSGDLVLLLNPDAVLQPRAMEHLVGTRRGSDPTRLGSRQRLDLRPNRW